MKQKELDRLAARLIGGPSDPDLYVRALEAAAVARRGLELLHEVAEVLADLHPSMRLLADPTQVHLIRPGDRLLDRDGEEARTDLMDEAAEQVRVALAAGSANDMADVLGGMTEVGLRKTAAGSLAELLETLPAGDLTRLQDVVERWSAPALDTTLLSRVANAMLPEAEGERSDRLRFAGDRLRDAAALLKVGREMLHEVAALLPSVAESDGSSAVETRSFTPGAWVRLGDVSVPTDPLELLGYEVAAIIAGEAAKLDQLDELLTALTRSLEEDGRPVKVMETYLTPEAAGELAAVLGVPETDHEESTAPSPRRPKRPVNLGQLRRALLKAPERHATIEDAWQALTSDRLSFARRWAAGVHLCRMTRELVRDDPSAAAAWAAQVGRAAETLAIAGGFARRMAEFLGHFASAHAGNALRVQGHLIVAERFFFPWEEDDHLGLRAEYLGLKAVLRQDQRQFSEALSLLEEADRIARRGDFPGSLDLAGRLRITQARIFVVLGDFDAASAFLRSALGLRVALLPDHAVIPKGMLSPHVRLIALQNLADSLSKTGELGEAGDLLTEVEELGKVLDLLESDRLRIRWVRARIDVKKAWHAGVDSLVAVRERFIELGLLYDAALASLELAEWHAEEITGTTADAEHLTAIRELAAESATFFAAQDIAPEAVIALVLFQHVASLSAPSAAAFRKIERLLRQAALS